jgi:hypothetical protein
MWHSGKYPINIELEVRRLIGTEGAAHLKIRDTTPPKIVAVVYTFVNKMSTNATGRNKGLRDFAATSIADL